jgi:hypothetical protein
MPVLSYSTGTRGASSSTRLPGAAAHGDPRAERDVPSGRPGIEWRLLTNLPVKSRAEAIEKLDWYAMRWKIEFEDTQTLRQKC